MAYLVPVQDQGLVILPTHRLLRNYALTSDTLTALKRFFTITEIQPTAEAIATFLAAHKNENALAVYDGAKAHGITLKNEAEAAALLNANSQKET